MPKARSVNLISGLMLLMLAAIWGGSFFFAEIALREVPPMTITLHRVFWAVPALVLVVAFKRIPLPRDPKVWGAYLVMGALNNAIPFSLIFWGQTQIESGLAAILNGTTAILSAVVASMLLADERLNTAKIIGALSGLGGIAVIMGLSAISSFSLTSLAQLAILGAALSYSFASVWGRVQLGGQPPLMNALGMLIGSTVLMFPLVLWHDGLPRLDLSLTVWQALFGLAVICSSFAYILYFAILARAGAANLMLVTLLIPPFSIALGAIFLDETLTLCAWIGFALIAVGLVINDGRLFAYWQATRTKDTPTEKAQ